MGKGQGEGSEEQGRRYVEEAEWIEESVGFELTVATFNLWGLNEPWVYTERRGEVRGAAPGSRARTMRVPGGAWVRRRGLVVEALREARADVVGLQEDRMVQAEGRWQSEQLAADLEMAYRAGAPTEGGVESVGEATPVSGNVVLSRYPVSAVEVVALPASAAEEERHGRGIRDALHAAIQTPGGLVHVFVAHLTTRGNAEQVTQAARLAEAVVAVAAVAAVPARTVGTEVASGHGKGAAIVVGDFNATPESATIAALTEGARLRDAWAVAHPNDPGYTMLFHTPRDPAETAARFDYVFVGDGPEIVGAQLLGTAPDADGFYASDHFGVAVTLRFP